MIQHLINHVSLVVDASGSMKGQPVVKVFDGVLNRLKARSVELDQETRVSIYLFNQTVHCLAFDMDVMRFKTLAGHWQANATTALIDATLLSLRDLASLPTKYGDHAFLQYVITDGGNNVNNHLAPRLKVAIQSLDDNWTVACLVPDTTGVADAKRFGFPADSIDKWNTQSSRGLEEVGQQFTRNMDSYFAMRANGVRGSKSFFKLDSSFITKRELTPLSDTSYAVYPVRRGNPSIKDFVESWTSRPYVLGSAYYQPTKPVEIQAYKSILVQDVKTGKVYEGDNLRQLLGLPDHTVKVNPGDHDKWRIFVQSTSVNRKLYPDTFVLVRQ